MNLHEECLLKYLLNPLSLTISTELLIQNNKKILKNLNKSSILAKSLKMGYSTNRI